MDRFSKCGRQFDEDPESLEELDRQIADLERQIQEAIVRRDAADKVAMELCDRILEAVRQEEGEDSELYKAMLFAGLDCQGNH